MGLTGQVYARTKAHVVEESWWVIARTDAVIWVTNWVVVINELILDELLTHRRRRGICRQWKEHGRNMRRRGRGKRRRMRERPRRHEHHEAAGTAATVVVIVIL